MLNLNEIYFIWFLIILIIEVSIAIFFKGGFDRNTLGDVFAVILLYCFLKNFINPKLISVCLLYTSDAADD